MGSISAALPQTQTSAVPLDSRRCLKAAFNKAALRRPCYSCQRPAIFIAADSRAPVAGASTAARLFDLRVVPSAKAAQVVEAIKRRRLVLVRARFNMVDDGRATAAARNNAAPTIAPQRGQAQRFPMRAGVIFVLGHADLYARAQARLGGDRKRAVVANFPRLAAPPSIFRLPWQIEPTRRA